MAISRDFIDKLTSTADVVDVISDYVSLKKNGRNYTGLCPFHSEKTPSFVVSMDKQIFHCFGCGAGGNALGFIMKIEGLEYPDAIRFLAKKYNLDVPEDNYNKENTKIRQRILEINKISAKFFYDNLLKPENEKIQKYLAGRKIHKKTATDFGIGYASNSFNELLNYLTKCGFSKDEMLKAGIISRNDKGNTFDKFRNRVMFPIIDVRGNVIAFGGRVIDDSMPKYLNSPETMVFNKSVNLFGLNIAKKTKNDYFILAEGYMDVIALHKAGFDSAVASLGTSLTDAQARLLLRHTKNVVIAYDGDNAGKKATDRAIEILKKVDLNVKVLSMRDAKDPDEFIGKYGKEAFLNLILQSEKDNEYKFNLILGKYNIDDTMQKLEFVKEVVKMLAEIENSVECEIFIIKTSEKTGISKQAIANEVSVAKKRKQKAVKKREIISPVKNSEPKIRGISYNDIKSAKAEEEIIALIFTDCKKLDIIDIEENRFSVEILKNVYIYSKKLYSKEIQIGINHLYEKLSQDEISYLTEVISREVVSQNVDKAILDYAKVINERYAIRTGDFELLQKLRSN